MGLEVATAGTIARVEGLHCGPAAGPSITTRPTAFAGNDLDDISSFPELDCLRVRLTSDVLKAASDRAALLGVGADRVLIASGALSEENYLRALSSALGSAFEPLDDIPRASCPINDERLIEAAATGLLPLMIDGNLHLVLSALQLSRDLKCQYKTAFVLAHKIREALGAETDAQTAQGTVEVDGGYFGGYLKPANWRENRRDRRLAKNQNGKRRVVIITRERGGRSLPFVVRNEAEAVPILEKRIRPGSTVHADEARSWDPLHYAGYDILRINHEEAYSDGTACTNNAESFFSRLRWAEIGQHHHIAGPYLNSYAYEAAWREDSRRIDNGTQFLLVCLAALSHPVSRNWKGYWQRRAPTAGLN